MFVLRQWRWSRGGFCCTILFIQRLPATISSNERRSSGALWACVTFVFVRVMLLLLFPTIMADFIQLTIISKLSRSSAALLLKIVPTVNLDYMEVPFGTVPSQNKGTGCTFVSQYNNPAASIWGDNLQCVSILMIIPTYSEISWQKSRLSEAIIMMNVCICSRECPARTAS